MSAVPKRMRRHGLAGYGDWHARLQKKERNAEIYRLWRVEEWSPMRLAKHFGISHWRVMQILDKESNRVKPAA